jgi:hypothetical protein
VTLERCFGIPIPECILEAGGDVGELQLAHTPAAAAEEAHLVVAQGEDIELAVGREDR